MPTRGRSLPTGAAASAQTRSYSVDRRDPTRGDPLMTRLRTLVLEDEWPARNYLVQLIEATQLAEVVGAVASVADAREALAVLPVDVVFVDVQLAGGETRLQLVQHLPGRPAVVPATALRQH